MITALGNQFTPEPDNPDAEANTEDHEELIEFVGTLTMQIRRHGLKGDQLYEYMMQYEKRIRYTYKRPGTANDPPKGVITVFA